LVIGHWPRVCSSRTCFPKIWNAIQIAGQGKTEWPNRQGVVAIRQVEIAEDGRIVHLPGYGLIRVFKIVATDGDLKYWASNDLEMSELRQYSVSNTAARRDKINLRLGLAGFGRHRGLAILQ
jgi:hypothetical protein